MRATKHHSLMAAGLQMPSGCMDSMSFLSSISCPPLLLPGLVWPNLYPLFQEGTTKAACHTRPHVRSVRIRNHSPAHLIGWPRR